MDHKTKLLFKAFLDLKQSEKEEFIKALREYNSKTIFEQRSYSDSLNRSLGPISGAKCAVCGK